MSFECNAVLDRFGRRDISTAILEYSLAQKVQKAIVNQSSTTWETTEIWTQ